MVSPDVDPSPFSLPTPQPICFTEMSHEPLWAVGAKMKGPGLKHWTANCYFSFFWPLLGKKLILVNLYQLSEVDFLSL